MGKPKSPLFSLGAHGTIADTLTYQKRSGVDFVREKPTPTDPRSLAQMYHRWLYRDYTLMWNALSAADRQTWKSLGSRHSRTGLSEFIKDKLTELEDLEGIWHLDETTVPWCFDSSPNNNHLGQFGTLPVTGRISICREFDGVNDTLWCEATPSLDLTNAMSLSAWVRPLDTGTYGVILSKEGGAYRLYFRKTPTPVILFYLWGVHMWAQAFVDIYDGLWHHLGFSYDKDAGANNMRILLDGDLFATQTKVGAITTQPTRKLYIGREEGGGYPYKGDMDELRLNNIQLPDTIFKAHSQRRYPL